MGDHSKNAEQKTKLYIVSNGVVWTRWAKEFCPVSSLGCLSHPGGLQSLFAFCFFFMKCEIHGLERGHRAFPPAPQAAQSADQVSIWIRRPKPQPHHGVQKLPRLIQAFSYRRNMKTNVKAHFQVHAKHKTHVLHHWL